MTLVIWSLFIATLLPFIAKIPLAYAMHQAGGYDNAHPREQQKKLSDFGSRALAAHQNAFESLIIFACAILTALATNTHSALIDYLAISHIVSRILYNLLYLFNISTLRSLIWFIATSCSFSILWQCLG